MLLPPVNEVNAVSCEVDNGAAAGPNEGDVRESESDSADAVADAVDDNDDGSTSIKCEETSFDDGDEAARL